MKWPCYIYALIEKTAVGGGVTQTLSEMAAKIRLMPSIQHSDSYTLSSQGSVAHNSRYANLFVHDNALYAKINNTGFYTHHVSADPSSHAHDNTHYVLTFISGQFSHGNVPWYSALDQFATSKMMNGTTWDAITPLSHVQLMSSMQASAFQISEHTQKDFSAITLKKDLRQAFQGDKSLSGEVQRSFAAHNALRSEGHATSHGSWNGWSSKFETEGLSADALYQQKVAGKTTGLSYDLSSSQALGYQFSTVNMDYQSLDQNAQGAVRSQIAQARSDVHIQGVDIQSQVTGSDHNIEHNRVIDVSMDEYSKDWTARSQRHAQEIALEQQVSIKTALSQGWSGIAGANYQGQYFHYDAYQEEGAEDLNLCVDAFQTLSLWVQPLAGVTYHQSSHGQWSYSKATVGYRHYFETEAELNYAFSEYDGQVSMPLAKPASSALMMGFEGAVGLDSGLSLISSAKVAYHGNRPSEYQGTVSAVWAF